MISNYNLDNNAPNKIEYLSKYQNYERHAYGGIAVTMKTF